MHLLLGLMMGVAVLLVLALIPLLILAGIFAILLHLVLLPFKLFGWGLKLGVGLAGALAKLMILLVAGVVLFLLGIGILPLLPLLLLGGGLFLILRAVRPAPRPVP